MGEILEQYRLEQEMLDCGYSRVVRDNAFRLRMGEPDVGVFFFLRRLWEPVVSAAKAHMDDLLRDPRGRGVTGWLLQADVDLEKAAYLALRTVLVSAVRGSAQDRPHESDTFALYSAVATSIGRQIEAEAMAQTLAQIDPDTTDKVAGQRRYLSVREKTALWRKAARRAGVPTVWGDRERAQVGAAWVDLLVRTTGLVALRLIRRDPRREGRHSPPDRPPGGQTRRPPGKHLQLRHPSAQPGALPRPPHRHAGGGGGFRRRGRGARVGNPFPPW